MGSAGYAGRAVRRSSVSSLHNVGLLHTPRSIRSWSKAGLFEKPIK